MSPGLLDVNVLLALFDPRHVHHAPAQRWLEAEGKFGWATCPVTENGFIRIASQPSYPSSPGSTALVRQLLAEFCAHRKHQFWAAGPSLRDDGRFDFSVPVSSRHLTDVWLLAVAVQNGGRLITFDRSIPVRAVHGGPSALHVLA